MASSAFAGRELAAYHFGGAVAKFRHSYSIPEIATASDLTDGRTGYGVRSSSTADPDARYALTTNKLKATAALAIAGNDFASFTVTAVPGSNLNLDSLSFDIRDSAAGIGGNWFVRSSVDGFTTDLGAFAATTSYVKQTIDLTGAAFQGLSSVTFRLYSYNTGTHSGTTAVHLDDVVLLDQVAERFSPQTIAAQSPSYFRHSEMGSLRLPSGRILLAWSRFIGATGDDNSPANIVLSYSDDNGSTWTSPVDLNFPQGATNNMQVSLLQVGNSTQLYYTKRISTPNADKWMSESTDNGATWSAPRKITPSDRRYTGPNDRMVRLPGGRILLPCHTDVTMNGRAELAPIIALSDDNSLNWTVGSPVLAEDIYYTYNDTLKFQEPALTARTDGSVWLLGRSVSGWYFESVSWDGGLTWTRAKQSKIEAMTAPPQLKRLSDGRLLLVWNPYTDEVIEYLGKTGATEFGGNVIVGANFKRSILAIATSADDGRTWSAPLVVADGSPELGYCYPSVLEVPETGEVLVFASKTPDIISPCDLVMFRVPLSRIPAIPSSRGSFIVWAAEAGLTGSDALPESKPFGDGIPNTLRYALGLDRLASPWSGMPSQGFVAANGNSYLSLSFTNPADRPALFSAEAGADLATWPDAGILINSGAPKVYRDTVPLSPDVKKRFMRLRVNLE